MATCRSRLGSFGVLRRAPEPFRYLARGDGNLGVGTVPGARAGGEAREVQLDAPEDISYSDSGIYTLCSGNLYVGRNPTAETTRRVCVCGTSRSLLDCECGGGSVLLAGHPKTRSASGPVIDRPGTVAESGRGSNSFGNIGLRPGNSHCQHKAARQQRRNRR